MFSILFSAWKVRSFARQYTLRKEKEVMKKSSKSVYDVINPLGNVVTENVSLAPSLANIQSKKIGFLWTGFVYGDELAEAFIRLISERFQDIKVVKLPSGSNQKWGDPPDESITQVVKDSGVDAVIVTVGA
jgi:hypothetical protein